MAAQILTVPKLLETLPLLTTCCLCWQHTMGPLAPNVEVRENACCRTENGCANKQWRSRHLHVHVYQDVQREAHLRGFGAATAPTLQLCAGAAAKLFLESYFTGGREKM